MGNIHSSGKRKERGINGNRKRRKMEPSPYTPPRLNGDLSELLTEEYYLEKILGYLVNDGFYECRFVCQKWKMVCDKLPVKLGPLGPERLKEAHQKFPNACSINNLISAANVPLEEVLQSVASFTRLRELSMFIDVDLSVSQLPLSLVQTFNGLQSLDIDWDCDLPCSEVLSFLGHLTSLTSLRISSSADLHPPNFPLTELRQIQCLDLQFSLFVYEDGEHVFPSLTKLTHLELYEFTDDVTGPDVLQVTRLHPHPSSNRGLVTQALNPFQSTLESLSLEFDSCLLEDIDLTPLKTYPRLNSVKLSGIIERGADLFPVLREMNNVTDLHISHIGFASLPFALLSLFAIRGLRSLWLDIIGDSIMEEAPLFPPFPNLMQLEVIGRGIGGSLRCLTTLVHLSLSLEGEETDAFLDSLACMSRLETLKIKHGIGLYLHGSAFSNLKRLKFLQLEGRADQARL